MEQTKKIKLQLALKSALVYTLPVLTGFLVLGIAYGVLMQSKGFFWGWSLLMSSVAFCGSMQFVAITLLTIPFNPVQAFLLSLMVNARHLFYGLSMLEKYHGLGKIRGFLIYTLCDETFSLSSSITPPPHIERKYFYFFISFLDYLYWILGTLLGSILGSLITFNLTGLDFVLTALFVVLFIEQLSHQENRVSGMIGVAASIVGLVLFGANNMIIPSMIILLFTLLAWRKIQCH